MNYGLNHAIPGWLKLFREMRLAENKGTGIGAVCRTMDSVGLTPPVFESDRRQNRFVATLWLHNLIDDDAAWLRSIVPEGLSDAQAQAIVVEWRTGVVRNAVHRGSWTTLWMGPWLAMTANQTHVPLHASEKNDCHR